MEEEKPTSSEHGSGSEIGNEPQNSELRRAGKNRSGAQKRKAKRDRLTGTGAPHGALGPQQGSSAPPQGTSRDGKAPARGTNRSGPLNTTEEARTGEASSSRKRARSPGQTPPSAKKTTKRTRPPGASRPVVEEALQVCVFCEGFPMRQLTNAEGNALVERIEECLFRTAGELAESGHIPSFRDHRFRQGALYVDCDDEQSRDWLRGVVNTLQLEGVSLRFASARDIPKPRRAVIHLRGLQQEPRVMLQNLEAINPGLGTSGWLIYGSERVGSNWTRIVVGLWVPSVRALRRQNLQPRYGLGRATVRLLGKDERPQGGDDPGPSNG